MRLKRLGVLLGKEFYQGPKSFIFIWVIVAPILISLVVTFAFGNFFSEKSKLGIVDQGSSQLLTMVRELTSITSREYKTPSEVKRAVERGAVDMGVILPQGLDSSVAKGEEVKIQSYIWGRSLAKSRTVLRVTVTDLLRKLAGGKAPINIEAISLGTGETAPWDDRLLPFLVLMAVFFSGALLPASLLIDEKDKKTLRALAVTPATLGDIFLTKGILGVVVSLLMGIVIMLLNQAFAIQPAALIVVLTLAAIMAVEIGLISGALLKDITSLFAIWKLGGILLFAPAFVYLFPQIPQWIGRVIPTYYCIEPIVQISQQGGGWSDIATSIFILIGVNVALAVLVMFTLKRMGQHLA